MKSIKMNRLRLVTLLAFGIMSLVAFTLSAAQSLGVTQDNTPDQLSNLSILISLIVTLAIVMTSVTLQARYRREQQDIVDKYFEDIESEEQDLTERIENNQTDFSSLWSVTQKRIKLYHTIATNQARTSFISGQVAISLGFVVLVILGVIASRADSSIAAITTGTVGVIGGAMSAYVGATFIKHHAQTSQQLSQFFLQPTEFTRFLAAERLLEGLQDEHKSEATKLIISSIMQAPRQALPTDVKSAKAKKTRDIHSSE